MVGVPGKYKGCETCRRRRVKCSNERPSCRNCTSSGRQCEGYERDRVFIIGTPETKGRVASHPRKSGPSRSPTPMRKEERPPLTQAQPFTPSWDDYISLSSGGVDTPVMMTALQTDLDSLERQYSADTPDSGFSISLPPYSPGELQSTIAQDDLAANAQCLARVGGAEDGADSTNNYCVFLFEHNSSMSKKFTPDQANMVKSLGANHFSSFPNHQFFVRVYRPMAVSLALMSRRDTFLASPEWTTTPWVSQPKSLFDELLDTILYLPSIFVRTDQIITLQPTLHRRARAQELLGNCLVLQTQFRFWLDHAHGGTAGSPHPYWTDDTGGARDEILFDSPYTFRDGTAGLMFLYYWMSQVLFHRCMESLHVAMFQHVVDVFPDVGPDLVPGLPMDPSQYQGRRGLAASICRGLDSALNNTAQPDMLLAPMTVALEFYTEINATSQDGLLETLWLQDFRRRLVAKGQHVADVLQGQDNWVEVAKF